MNIHTYVPSCLPFAFGLIVHDGILLQGQSDMLQKAPILTCFLERCVLTMDMILYFHYDIVTRFVTKWPWGEAWGQQVGFFWLEYFQICLFLVFLATNWTWQHFMLKDMGLSEGTNQFIYSDSCDLPSQLATFSLSFFFCLSPWPLLHLHLLQTQSREKRISNFIILIK